MRIKFTEKALTKLGLPAGRRQLKVWDTEQPGLGLLISAASAVYVANVKYDDGKYHQRRIGKRGEISIQQARLKVAALHRGETRMMSAATVTDAELRAFAATIAALVERAAHDHDARHSVCAVMNTVAMATVTLRSHTHLRLL